MQSSTLWKFRVGLALLPLVACAQRGRPEKPTLADTLLGSLNPYRTNYDVTFYDLSVQVDPVRQTITGEVVCQFRWEGGADTLQIDLDERLTIKGIWVDGVKARYRRVPKTRAVWVALPQSKSWAGGSSHTWQVQYGGKPRVAPRPPWDGGFVWEKTSQGKPWIGVACQGLGASVWWPLKDHLSDEPDSLRITVCVPSPLRAVANGQPASTSRKGADSCFTYRVTYPINTYNVTFYAAPNYVTLEDTFHSASGQVVPMRFTLLPEHAQKGFPYMATEARKVLRAMEHYFGPFPPQRDGYGLVESPYYGMEHQSAIAYGNHFRKDAEWGFDYIILHETGHEWWGNHVTVSDNADLWVQEGFCTYSEALYVEYYQGYEAAVRYLTAQKTDIQNRRPIQGPKGINYDQTHNTDIYYKAAWMLHTLRSIVNNDPVWFRMLRALQDSFSFKVTSTEEVIAFISRQLGGDYEPFFRAYLYETRPPVLQYAMEESDGEKRLKVRCLTPESRFDYPVEFLVDGEVKRYAVGTSWRSYALPASVKEVRPNGRRYYFLISRVE
jgi:aminopeptidase N